MFVCEAGQWTVFALLALKGKIPWVWEKAAIEVGRNALGNSIKKNTKQLLPGMSRCSRCAVSL